ncbi:MAG TPA: DUF2069 domain-containing protein [Burkholderiaceae bacterium]|jgi:uncharacterized membrane protein|nr:DUF2069 domain-containing protein [Burkholderiaceae bacterium]
MSLSTLRRIVAGAFVALILLGLAWELWLAPLRPGGSALSLKVLPLAAALPWLQRGRVRTYQWWSMLVLGYFAEGLVRATSERGPAVLLASVETALAVLAFTAILLYVRAARRPMHAVPAAPDRASAAPRSPAAPDR